MPHRPFFEALICVVLTVNPVIVFAQKNDSTWISSASGCKIYNPRPVKNETITWDGTCLHGYANGYGKLVWFRNGKVNQVFEGIMKRGAPEGKGRYDFANGDIYEGNFMKGDFDGIGHYTSADKHGQIFYSYFGEFKNDDKNGYGTEVIYYSNSSDTAELYEGYFKDDVRQGEGRQLTYMLKKIYQEYYGTFADDKPDGKGKFLFLHSGIKPAEYLKITRDSAYTQEYCDELYIGNVIKGERTGNGKYFYKNAVYDGDWNGNMREGTGTLIFNSKLLYEGQWEDDQFNGFGKGYHKGSLNYVGYWKKNLRSGFGIWRYSNNGVYVGEFKKHLYNGFGYIIVDGSIAQSGKWVNGALSEKLLSAEVIRKLKAEYLDYDTCRKIIIDN